MKKNCTYTIKEKDGRISTIFVLDQTIEGGMLIKENNITRFLSNDTIKEIEIISEGKKGILLD